ncbi:uncharacterized protein LOC112566544 isoform X2 [Pomacea canaliculata]|uniref:uncharacterized protein LOC112566544 isoform X2 n=1 Tax=Pomacea canaliculata TaxID=400727 RepID=UPI000D733784|nr:uncharacterized protein LOC112566544 isoform X2 [Pomacea canaliculata]
MSKRNRRLWREEEKRRAEQNHESRKQEMLDLVNDPVLRRVSKKTQNIPKYTKPPDSRPTAVCFDIDGPSLTHSVVKFQMDTLIEDFDDFEVKVVSVEYQPRAIHIKGIDVENRWVITLDSQYAAARLSGSQLLFGTKEVIVRRYDDVIGFRI